jgi:hypothetical protein
VANEAEYLQRGVSRVSHCKQAAEAKGRVPPSVERLDAEHLSEFL